jgi:multisubunit Na+/H+ antiporter MnhG subunit
VPLFCVLLFIFLSYWPGQSGGLILDDVSNLQDLSLVSSKDSFLRFVFGGESSVIGRPLSLLSFAVQAGAWSDSPSQLFLVNHVIHMLNVLLVFFLARAVFFHNENRTAIALIVCLVWGVMPLHVSSVNYLIQRMALLSAFFSLLSTIFLLRAQLSRSAAFLVFSLAMLGMGLLAKENALGLSILFLAHPRRNTNLQPLADPNPTARYSSLLLQQDTQD